MVDSYTPLGTACSGVVERDGSESRCRSDATDADGVDITEFLESVLGSVVLCSSGRLLNCCMI